jgi:chromatin remodeling complex protein RSC6
MPQVKRNTDTKTATPVEVAKTPVAAPVEVAKVAVAAPVEVAKPEVKKAPRAKAVKIAETVAPSSVKTEEPVKDVSEQTDDKETPSSENIVQVLVEKITSLTTLNKEIHVVLKQVVRDYDRLRKVVDKIQKKRENARKSPSGFAKPNKISNELCDFIGVPHGTEKSRTDITRYINTYVKEHNLNKPTNRRIILPDDKLKAILNVQEGEEVTFFILQRLISHHFPPTNKQVAAAAVANAIANASATAAA